MAAMSLELSTAEATSACSAAPPSAADEQAHGQPAAPAWAYTVSVRELCEFTAKRGDLDRRFTPSATALEGLMGQSTVAQRRGQDYETEIALEATCGPLRVRGRADGYDPRRRCLEEIKTIRGHPDEIPENRRQLHWVQLQTYGALFCRARSLSEIALALVYFDVASQSEVELRQVFGAEELEEVLAQRCGAFLAWARQEAGHRVARDQALRKLAFPEEAFRAGQRDLAEAVYRTAANGRCLLAQAPTGIGKTVGTLFPLPRTMTRPLVKVTSSRTCRWMSHPAAATAGVMNLVQMSRSLSAFLSTTGLPWSRHPDEGGRLFLSILPVILGGTLGRQAAQASPTRGPTFGGHSGAQSRADVSVPAPSRDAWAQDGHEEGPVVANWAQSALRPNGQGFYRPIGRLPKGQP